MVQSDSVKRVFNKTKIKKIQRLIAGFIVLVSLGNYLGYLPVEEIIVQKALAQANETSEKIIDPIVIGNSVKKNTKKLGIIAILVEEGLMEDFAIRSRVMTYAQSAQERIPHSKSFVIEVNQNESTFRIASLLEKLYFEGVDTDLIDSNPLNDNGIKEEDNELTGIVIIGNVPIPVVHESDGTASPSIYPYVNFYRKKYIYNHPTDTFEVNSAVSDMMPDIWHGLITPPSKDPATAKKELIDYFDKNYKYTQGEDGFATFEKRMLVANFPEMEKRMNYLDYGNYQRYLTYMEEMVMNRFNKHLLKALIRDVSRDMGSPDNPVIDDASINNMLDVQTETIFKKYAYNLGDALKTYRSGLNEAVQKTGRWQPGEVDSPESLIALRDEYAKYEIKRKMLMLEKKVNDFVIQNLSFFARQEDMVTSADLKIDLKINGLSVDSNVYTFTGFFNGIASQDIMLPQYCGITAGQKRQEGQSVLENNSVYVEANRMYNPATLLTPPEDSGDWKLEDQEEYKKYAGCVFNNSVAIEETGTKPSNCKSQESKASIFDIVGSKEITTEAEGGLISRCDADNMFFWLGNVNQYFSTAVSGFLSPVSVNESFMSVIDKAYTDFNGKYPFELTPAKASYVVQQMIRKGQPLIYSPQEGVEIELKLTTQTKPIDSFFPHVEPTNETIKAIKHIGEPRINLLTGEANMPQITTPSTPSDGIRYLSFAKDGIKQAFEYLNLFRIKGNNSGEITGDLFKKITDKQNELDIKTGTKGTLFKDFLANNSEVIEPIIWKTQSIDQKLATIIPKYIDANSFMPTPAYEPKQSPENKPDGYEVLQIIANGDARGYEFGLNRAMKRQQAEKIGENTAEAASADTIAEDNGTETTDVSSNGQNGKAEEDFVCGDPSGVEIWEWFDSLQCWIEKEILPAEKLFQLSNVCSAAAIPPDQNLLEEKNGDLPNAPDITLEKPTSIEATMKRQSLVPGEKEVIHISAVNDKGEPVLGYIDMQVRLELSDPELGSFSANDFFLFTGERDVSFTAKKSGSATLKITMGNLPEKVLDINVHDSIIMEWEGKETVDGGRSEFIISVRLKSDKGEDILNINDEVVIGPMQPADGGFASEGRLKLAYGKGEIKFLPTPGKKEINLISKDAYISSDPFIIRPTGGAASQIILRAPSYIPMDQEGNVEVIAADSFGLSSDSFNDSIIIELSGSSTSLATLKQTTVKLTKGKGTLTLKTGKETGDINLKATHPKLKSDTITLPIMARVNAGDWKNMAPQTLFASFVGFPAGDFTQENYFGGVHLFSGKTEAVYSFLTNPKPTATLIISPNNLIQTSDPHHRVLVEFPEKNILLQVFDQSRMQTMVSKKIPMNFRGVKVLEGNQLPEAGVLYVKTTDENYIVEPGERGLLLKNRKDEVIADFKADEIHVKDNNFYWIYETQPEFNVIELKLTDGLNVAATIYLSFKAEDLKAETFEEINPDLYWEALYGGKSTNDSTGLIFFNHGVEVLQEKRNEFYGLEKDNDYLSRFASGTNIGDAIRYNMPVNAILLGDPTIRLTTKSTTSLNYNSAAGQQIYKDSKSQPIASINHFNFNNDEHDDVAVLTKDGRVRLLEGGGTEPPYKDRGDMAFLVDGGVALERFDFKQDGYDDLLIATEQGRLAILNNDKKVMTRRDQKLNIGKKMTTLLKGDMDNDGSQDLVILDSRGDIYIVYYDPQKGVFPENGTWIGNYGYSLNLEANLNTDLDIRYPGIKEPDLASGGSETVSQAAKKIVSGSKPELKGYEEKGGGNINESAAETFIKNMAEQNKQASKDPQKAIENITNAVPKLPWMEGNETETYFAPIESLGFMNVSKKVSNKDRPGAKNVDLEETLTYTIEITPGSNLGSTVLADTVPDALSFLPQSVTCVSGGCNNIKATQNSVRVFFSGLNLAATQKTIITYDVFVAHTPQASMALKRMDEPNENLANPGSIIDPYMDILVSPPYNNTGKLIIHYSTGPRSYAVTQSNQTKPKATNEAVSDFSKMMQAMEDYSKGNFDEDNPPPPPKFGNSLASALDKITGNNDCFEDPENTVGCAKSALEEVATAIKDFACMGGGCFPMPFNRAFLVPPEFPLPVFAFPTTLPTPVGPMPFIWPGSFIGAANIPGPIMSMLRLYLSPTLTGGIGVAFCWGPYPQVTTVPPPVFPVPYPPPIGNCMVTALPVDEIYAGLCSAIRDGITDLMDAMSSGVDKINSSMNEITNDPNIPVNLESGGSQQGAGGLEVSLAVNLGNSQKFIPPVNSFSNIHIPTFDSIGGVIASWFDRQAQEIENKLLTLPTFSIYMPDLKSLFTLDFQKTKKAFTAWENVLSGSGRGTLDAIEKIGQTSAGTVTKNQTIGQKIRGGLQDVSGSKALSIMGAIEQQASVYNLNALEGLYDAVSTLPLVSLNQKPIQLDIPWLSSAEIQAWISQAQDWVLYYEREYSRVKDTWEKLSCQDQPDAKNASSVAKNAASCTGRHLADMFEANFEPLLDSVKQNIAVLQSYLAYPKELVNFKEQLANYIKAVACYLDEIGQMMGGWMATIQQQIASWAELILTIAEIIKNIEKLFDVFSNFDSSCDTCTNERYANFGWWTLLGVLLPDLPVIQFPKIPDVVLDLSNINANIAIDLPILKIRPKAIPLPPLPYIELPDVPTANLLLSLPPLPILPKLPPLPELPPLPPLPTIKLPTLPPPPKLPDLGEAFDIVLPILEAVLNVWCTVKKSFAPVPEMMLTDQITRLTTRPAYLTPLDIIKVQLPTIAPFDVGFNQIRIETIIYLGLRLSIITKPLEEAAKTWNGWIQTIPEEMKKAYKEYQENTEKLIQEKLDEVQSDVSKAVEEAEQTLEDGAQGWLDKNIGDPLEEANKWARDKEKEWEEWALEQGIKGSYEAYYTGINNLNKTVNEWSGEAAEDIKQWFTENNDWIHGLNYLIPLAPVFELINEENLGDEFQNVLNLVSEKLTLFESMGPTLLQRLYSCVRYWGDCKVNEQKYFGNTQAGLTDMNHANENKMIAQLSNVSEEEYIEAVLKTSEGQQIKSLLQQMGEEIKKVNNGKLVDYKVLKEKLGVPDYTFANRPTTVDKLNFMSHQLIQRSDEMLAEVQGLKHVKDLNAIAGVAPKNDLLYDLAAVSEEDENEEKLLSNALPVETTDVHSENSITEEFLNLKAQVKRMAAQANEQDVPTGGLQGACKAAVCLPDPITKNPVPVIPFIELKASSETLFMPNGHLIYSDGTGLYLKRDLTINDQNENTDNGIPKRFSFNEIGQILGLNQEPKEAINMLQTSLTENGASTFNWLPSSNPAFYGYGIELERTVTGYDVSEKNNQLPDTKIILLPKEENGTTPKVFAGDQQIGFGTLVTSLESKEEAAARFGVSPKNIVTGITEVHFPTIGNALIKIDKNKAVYFDQLEGAAYSMNMQNGYYQIRMTWFDRNADTATYNQHEMLAPQLYAGAAEPIEVNQTDMVYMPLFKSKTVNASDFFVDLGDAYNYYWFINPESNTLIPEEGKALTIPAQNQEKSFKIKLVATQDITDRNFKKFEKIFNVKVYVPEISLEEGQLKDGVIAGTMKPPAMVGNDDLSDIPFSVFRNRGNLWKNIGTLKKKNTPEIRTNPAMSEGDHYYSTGSDGSYYIENFTLLDPSPLILKDNEGNILAEVEPENGKINLKNNELDLVAEPGNGKVPTHIVIMKKETGEVAGSVNYVAESNTDVEIMDGTLDVNKAQNLGVTVSDANAGDDIVAKNLPGQSPTFPGGVSIFHEKSQENIALVDTNGTIRITQKGYQLSIRNKDSQNNDKYIFTIVTQDGAPVFDIFINADFKNLNIDNGLSTASSGKGGEVNKTNITPPLSTPVASETEDNNINAFPFEPEAPLEVSGSPFKDVNEAHPYYKQILELYKNRVVSGFSDGTFLPDQKLTRAEFIKIALGVTNCIDCTTPNKAQQDKYKADPFPDVSLPSWYYYCIAIAKELGMVTGYGDGLFRPNRNISRAEAAAVLMRQAGVEIVKAPENAFVDVPDYAWYVDYVYTAVQIGLIKSNVGFVSPDEEITRGEFAFMASGVKNIKECRLVDTDQDGVPDWWEMSHDMDLFTPDAQNFCPCSNNPWSEDTDGDGKRDVCDVDIDNDGVLNPICLLTEKGEIDKGKLGTGKVDNCIFVPNTDQGDYDENGVGDKCDATPICPCVDNPNQNDTDGDGIRDVCDVDIDNDGFVQSMCIFDDNGLLDAQKSANAEDNCIFVSNADQSDENGNKIGDACEAVYDLCPGIPEDVDGVDDEDGCPDLNDEVSQESGVFVSPGELCGIIDFKTDFMNGDLLMTAITDLKNHDVVFSKSKEAAFNE